METNLSKESDSASKLKWIFIKLKKPPCGKFLWKIASNFTIFGMGIFSKILTRILNKTVCYNESYFLSVVQQRDKNVPLITVSNHHSCFDDPGIWGSLKCSHFNSKKMRWSLAAHNICFTNTFHSYFFMLGKCIPIVRGIGVYQEGIDFCIEKLKEGDWVHIFPEGRVNTEKEFIRFKWGIGRVLYSLPITPTIIPIWHIGMEDILPNRTPYMFRSGKLLTLNFGHPIVISKLIQQLRLEKTTPEKARQTITDYIQKELMKLKEETEKLHNMTL